MAGPRAHTGLESLGQVGTATNFSLPFIFKLPMSWKATLALGRLLRCSPGLRRRKIRMSGRRLLGFS